MKFLVVGLGSMGKRRIRNLKYLNQNDIIGFDPKEERCVEASENNIHFFTEASVVQNEMQDVILRLKNTNLVALPSCTMRYHPIVKQVNAILKSQKIGKPLAVLYHSGQYLPDWHPWEDYRKFYVSKRETGACREMVPFEIGWLQPIFGKILSVMANKK